MDKKTNEKSITDRKDMKDMKDRKDIRINDRCVFKYHAIKNNARLTENQLLKQFFPGSSLSFYQLSKSFYEIDLLETPAPNHIHRSCKQKINLLLKHLFPDVLEPLVNINLSAGGMAFYDNNHNDTDNIIYIMLIIDSHPVPLLLKGRVAFCLELDDQAFNYRSGIQFETDGFEEAIQTIIKYINTKNS